MLKSYNPATNEVIEELKKTTVSEISEIVLKSKKAQKSWGQLSAEERINQLQNVFQDIEDNQEKLIELINQEMGKSLQEATGEVKGVIKKMPTLYSEIKEALKEDIIEDKFTRSEIYYSPKGVVACIAPWNFPFGVPTSLIIPTLLMGNTVIFKPSEETSLIGKFYFSFLNKHLPKNVISIVIGDGEQGAALTNSDVDMVAFVGSKATGQKIAESASKELKKVVLELGGKDPLIVCEGSNIDEISLFAAQNSFYNSGQVCVSTERIYVHDSLYDQFVDSMVEKSKEFKVKEANVDWPLGPMINFNQKKKVIEQVESALKDGAKIKFGKLNTDETNFLDPLVIVNLSHSMKIMKEETFGPVACVMKFSNDEEVIELANDSEFGLGGSLFGSNIDKLKEMAKKIRIGMIGINKGCRGAAGTPWVGVKNSGLGYLGSIEGHRQFCELRMISINK